MKHALSILIPKGRLIIKKRSAAFSMIEALLAGSLLALVIFTLSSVLIFGQESSRISGDRQRAAALAEEGLEAARNMSEASFSSLAAGPHGLVVSGGKWQFSGTEDYPEIFHRSLIVSDLDAYTKVVTSTVTWAASPQRDSSVSLSSRFTNWRRSGFTMGNWASTTVESGYSPSNTSAGERVRVDGDYAYVGLTGFSSNNFLIYDISTSSAPTLVGQATVAGNINDLEFSGDYVYIASSDNSAEMRIIDVTNKNTPTPVGTYNAAGNGDGLSIDVIGTTVYLGRAQSGNGGELEVYVINAANHDGPFSLGGYNAADSIFDIQVSSDSHAYLATGGNSAELRVLDVATPTSISSIGTLNISGSNNSLDAWAIVIFDSNADGIEDRAIIGRTGEGRIWPIDVLDPTHPSLILSSGYTVSDMGTSNINYLELFNSNKYLALATNAATAEVVLLDVTTLNSPTSLSIVNISGANNFAAQGLAYAAGVDRLLAVGARVTPSFYSFVIIKPN